MNAKKHIEQKYEIVFYTSWEDNLNESIKTEYKDTLFNSDNQNQEQNIQALRYLIRRQASKMNTDNSAFEKKLLTDQQHITSELKLAGLKLQIRTQILNNLTTAYGMDKFTANKDCIISELDCQLDSLTNSEQVNAFYDCTEGECWQIPVSNRK